MLSRLFRAVLIALGSLLLPAVVSAAQKWHTLQAPHCLIVSQLSEKETRAWATQFEQFTAAVSELLVLDKTAIPPLTIVLFAKAKDFDSYGPAETTGIPQAPKGFYGSKGTWSVIGLAGPQNRGPSARIVFHDTALGMMGSARPEIPVWLGEGFAEVFSTFAPESGEIVGRPIPQHIKLLQSVPWAPFHEAVTTNRHDSIFNGEPIHMALLQAQVWLFAHRLLTEDQASTTVKLDRYITALRNGADQATAFAAAFGMNTAATQEDLSAYLLNNQIHELRCKVPFVMGNETLFAPATADIVEVALARLALCTGRYQLAREHIDRARNLTPATPEPLELLAIYEYSQQNDEAAFNAATQALSQGSRDALMHIVIGNSTMDRQLARGPLGVNAREIAAPFVKAARRSPKLRAAYIGFANAAPNFADPTLEDARFLAAGCDFFPDEPGLLFGLAGLRLNLGDTQEAQRVLRLLLSHEKAITESQRAVAESMLNACSIAAQHARIDELVRRGNFDEALAACESLLASPLPPQLRPQLEKEFKELAFEAALQAASKSDTPVEATRLLEDLSKRPDLNQRQLRRIREHLHRIRLSYPDLAPTSAPTP